MAPQRRRRGTGGIPCRLVLRVLGEHTFKRFIEIKRSEWADYRVQVTPWEVDKFLPVL